MKITHVCHQWREVALGLCELWSEVWFTSRAEIAEVFVKRAQRARMKFRMELSISRGADEHRKFLKLVLENLDHAEEAKASVNAAATGAPTRQRSETNRPEA